MAASLQTAKLFKILRTLFREEDGSPAVFYSDRAPDDLKQIVMKGGGVMTDTAADASILLCEKKTDNRIYNNGYLPFDFIVDCVKRNSFLNVDKYRCEVLGLQASTSVVNGPSDASSVDEEELIGPDSSHLRLKASDLAGRRKYSDVDDFKIIKYLINHKRYRETGGNIVWKQMESLKITDHTHQSMKARFKKNILPELDSYDIPQDWKAKLRGQKTHDSPSRPVVDVTSFDQIDQWKKEEQARNNIKRNNIKSALHCSVSDQPSPSCTENILMSNRAVHEIRSRSNSLPIDSPNYSPRNTSPSVNTRAGITTEKGSGNININKPENFALQISAILSTEDENVNSVNMDENSRQTIKGENSQLLITEPLTEGDSDDEIDRWIISEAKKAETDRARGKNYHGKDGSRHDDSSVKDSCSDPQEDVPVAERQSMHKPHSEMKSRGHSRSPKSSASHSHSNDTRTSRSDSLATSKHAQRHGDDHCDWQRDSDCEGISPEVDYADGRKQKKAKMANGESRQMNEELVGNTDASYGYADMTTTRQRVQFLSDMYGLDKKEAAAVLMYHKGNFQTTVQYLDS